MGKRKSKKICKGGSAATWKHYSWDIQCQFQICFFIDWLVTKVDCGQALSSVSLSLYVTYILFDLPEPVIATFHALVVSPRLISCHSCAKNTNLILPLCTHYSTCARCRSINYGYFVPMQIASIAPSMVTGKFFEPITFLLVVV